MTSTLVHLEPSKVPAALRGSYSGKKFAAVVTDAVSIPVTAGLWDGGSRDKFSVILLSTGEAAVIPGQDASPWDRPTNVDRKIKLQPGFAVVRHTISCGKDVGLTFYIHPENVTALLPAPVELSDVERFVLNAAQGLKSSYNGKDRFQLATAYERDPITREEWDATCEALIERRLLNKARAITIAGRNAIA